MHACSVTSVVSDSLRLYECSTPSSSVHGIIQARILEWVAVPFSRGYSTQGWNPHLLHLLHWLANCLPLSHPGNPKLWWWVHSSVNKSHWNMSFKWVNCLICKLYLNKMFFLSSLCTDMQWSPGYKVLIIIKNKTKYKTIIYATIWVGKKYSYVCKWNVSERTHKTPVILMASGEENAMAEGSRIGERIVIF